MKKLFLGLLILCWISSSAQLRKDQLNAINARDIKSTGAYSSFKLGKLIDSLILSLNSQRRASGYLPVGNASGIAMDVPLSGDGTLSNAGVLSVTKLLGNAIPPNALGSLTNDGSGVLTWSSTSITGQALTKTDDTNVTLTLGGSPSTALLNAASITVGWTGTLADGRIASSSNWNTAYNRSPTSLGFTASTFTLTKQDASALTVSVPTFNQNTTGTAAAWTTGRTLSITGDLSYTSPSIDGTGNVTAAGTLATVNSNVGTFGSATKSLTATVNGKGLITAISEQTVTPAIGSITGLGANVATWLATPSSANLAAALTDETGTGADVFAGSPAFTGTPTLGTLGYSDTGILWSWQSSTNSYNQVIIQNTNSGSTASTNYLVSNDIGTATTHYAEFGKNSSGFTGSGSWQIANGSYLDEASDDLAIGTLANKTLHFFTNSSTTDRLSIDGTGLFTFVAPVPNNSFTSSWTATANNQSSFQILGTITSANTNNHNWNGVEITQTLARNAGNPSGQKATGVLINTTFSNSPTISNILRLQAAGTDYFTFSGTGDSMLNFGASGSGTSPNIRVGGTFFIIDPVAPYSILDLARNGNSVQLSSGRLIVSSGGVSTAGGITFFANGNISLTSSGTFGADFSSDSNGRFYIPTSGYIGINSTSPAALLHISNHNTTPLSAASWTTNGIQARFDAATYTDTGATGTRATGVAIGINQPTFTNATSAVITITDAATWYVANAPTSSNTSTGSMTLTRPWSLWIDAGNSRFDGNLDFAQADATNFVFGTSTGTKIGTSTSQKLSFYNSTPIVQPANTVAIDDVLINTGLRASGGSANFTLKVTHSLPENLKNYTVATLPAGTRGDIAYVTDALTPSFLVVVVGGGSTVTPVFFDGTNWVVF